MLDELLDANFTLHTSTYQHFSEKTTSGVSEENHKSITDTALFFQVKRYVRVIFTIENTKNVLETIF